MAKHKPVRVLDPARSQLTIVGCGGTGGALLPQAARLLYGLKELRRGVTPPLFGEQPPDGVPKVLLVDGDEVERKNLFRQNFLANDLNRPKALVLAERYGAAFGLEVAAYPRYVNAATDFTALIPEGGVVVGCVDNAKTRRLLHDRLSRYSDVVYVDAGNAGVDLPEDGRPPKTAAP